MRRRTNATAPASSGQPSTRSNTSTRTTENVSTKKKINHYPKTKRPIKRRLKGAAPWWSPLFWWDFFVHRATEQQTAGQKSQRQTTRRNPQGFYLGINRLTVHGSLLLLVTMALAIYYNRKDGDDNNNGVTVDPAVLKLMQRILAPRSMAHSHQDLIPSGRTQWAIREIPANELVLKIPREYLIWDLDALRDEWIQEQSLLDARLTTTMTTTTTTTTSEESVLSSKPLESYVFLAIHLVRLLQRVRDPPLGALRIDPVMQVYLRVLPTFPDFQRFHPIFWNATKRGQLRITSASHDLLSQYRQEMEQSYLALAKVSTDFSQSVPFEEFAAALLNVWTRSFGTGPLLPPDETDDTHEQEDLRVELQDYMDDFGIDLLTKGCHSMVPVLDLYNHFGTNPNVGFAYNTSQGAFVVTSTMRIPVGQEVMDSYGKHTEAHLFAKYGFVHHVAGSDYTQASLALYHPVYSSATKPTAPSLLDGDDIPSLDATEQQMENSKALLKKQMLHYLQFDDGYQECVAPPKQLSSKNDGRAAWEFKELKFRHLLLIARNSKRWHVFLSPRSPKAKPPQQSTILASTTPAMRIPKFAPSRVQFDANPIMATCRLIVMTHFDYDENATSVLSDNLHEASFVPPRTEGDALQFRELMCVLRFADMALKSFFAWSTKNLDGAMATKKIASIEDQIELVKALNEKERLKAEQHHGNEYSSDWQVAHLHLAEMQALQVVKEVAARMIQSIFGAEDSQTLLNSKPEYSMRQAPCPMSYQAALLKPS